MARNRREDVEEEINNTFIIPNNFMDSGKIFQGMFEIRNVVEAIIAVVVIGYSMFHLLTIDIKMKLVIMIVVLVPIGISALIGFQGDSITLFIKKLFLFIRNKRKLRYRRIKKNVEKTSTKTKTRA
ncbi:hypothetical protein, partial [Thomasclavelia cocleata]|uniref:hypothetical protein n=1 Tax=Thomasclavelia cocleata TaxID=69824 RepID=UPI0025A0BDEF